MSTAPSAAQTTNTFAQEQILASSRAECALLNANLQFNYDTAVRNYNLNAGSGQTHVPPLVPPVAPLSWIVLAPDANGYQWYAQTGPPLTPTPPLTIATTDLGTLTVATPIPNHLSINWATWRPGNPWVDANKDDGWPNALVTPPQTAPDGSTHTYERFSDPFGAMYLQVS
jgi:hypothetical protein